MTLRESLLEAETILKSTSDTAFLDSMILLAHALNKSKESLIASFKDSINLEAYQTFKKLIHMRLQGEPIAYITKNKEFYGLNFYVDSRVLIPRADTEILVETALLKLKSFHNPKVLDLCTGSACIALSLKKEYPQSIIHAVDISEDALEVARINQKNLDLKIELFQSDLFLNIQETYDIIVTNPPYLDAKDMEERKNWKEPTLALHGFGEDGLQYIRKIIMESPQYLNKGAWLLIEAAPWQLNTIEELLKMQGFIQTSILHDLANNKRITIGLWA